MRNRFNKLIVAESIHGLFYDKIFYCEISFLLFLFWGQKIVAVHFCTFIVLHSYRSVYGDGGATQKSLELQVFPRNYQCLMVSKMTYGEGNDEFFWQANYHEGDNFWKIIAITYVITYEKLQTITKLIYVSTVSYHESWYPVIIRISRILISVAQPWLSRNWYCCTISYHESW